MATLINCMENLCGFSPCIVWCVIFHDCCLCVHIKYTHILIQIERWMKNLIFWLQLRKNCLYIYNENGKCLVAYWKRKTNDKKLWNMHMKNSTVLYSGFWTHTKMGSVLVLTENQIQRKYSRNKKIIFSNFKRIVLNIWTSLYNCKEISKKNLIINVYNGLWSIQEILQFVFFFRLHDF